MTAPKLAYLVFGVKRPAAWTELFSQVLGLPAPVANSDGSQGWQLDDAAQSLVVQQDRADDVLAIGWEFDGEAALRAAVDRAAAAGVAVEPCSRDLARARRVEQLHALRDPQGNRIELCAGRAAAAAPFASAAFPKGFVTGELGLGHAVLVTRDVDALVAFYVRTLGLRVTETLKTRVGPLAVHGVFLHCNRRHHSLAIFNLPSRTRMHHFMLQAADVLDVGRAFGRATQAGIPLSLGLGQHPDPDGTFSFYAATPSGFDFEIGAGGRTIEPQAWEPGHASVASAWGHEPQLRTKLRLAWNLAARARPAPAVLTP